MADERIILTGLWTALMLTYLLGDVIRIFAGAVTPGHIGGHRASPAMWMLAAVVMLVPIVMLVLSLTLPTPSIRWAAVVASGLLVLSNLAGLPYPGAYDNFLIGVGFVFKRVDHLVRLDLAYGPRLSEPINSSAPSAKIRGEPSTTHMGRLQRISVWSTTIALDQEE